MLILLLPSLFFHSLLLVLAYEDPRGQFCGDNNTTYASNSTFSTNLSLALTTLRNSTAATGFNATTSATTNLTDSVTALALCRANLSSSDCQTCVDAATSGILLACPNQTSAQVWYTLCMVRYSSFNFITKPDYSIHFMLYDVRDAPNEDVYDPKVTLLMQNLSYTAGVSDIRSAVGKTSTAGNRSIYGYVDCTRDINGPDCTTCLLDATDSIPSCCLGKWAGWIATPTCNIQFDMDPVHDDWINPPEINTDLSIAPAPVIEPPAEAGKGGLGSSDGGGGGGAGAGKGGLGSSDGGGGGGAGGKERSIILVVVGVVAFILVVGVILVVRWRRKRADEMRKKMEGEATGVTSFLYDLDVLVAATGNFSSANRLGGGGFGTVYRGRLDSGEEIAVKKLTAGSMQGIEEFSNEVRLLLKMQHRNLVRLLGCCVQGEEMMLVYEYLPNRSLDYFLFDKSKSALLDWTKRFNIIMGVGRGLVYLHEDSQLKIIHRDIKASNILLDEQMNPKISDFGLARLFNDEQSRLKTRRIMGTFGYMAPEYAIRGVVSTKIDIFSFGVLMLETISGRKNFDQQLVEEEQELLNFTRKLEQEGRLMELVDVTIGSLPREDVLRCIKIGLLCCQESVQDRPTMSSTLIMLTSNSVTMPLAGRLAYQQSSINPSSQSFSNNSVTTSLACGR